MGEALTREYMVQGTIQVNVDYIRMHARKLMDADKEEWSCDVHNRVNTEGGGAYKELS